LIHLVDFGDNELWGAGGCAPFQQFFGLDLEIE
jgi:hypothetical protein